MLMSRLASSAASSSELGADPVGDVVVDLLAEEDDAVPQQPLEQLVPERHAGGAPPRPSIEGGAGVHRG